jgi:glycosyltransferase involved in cell wall biosynthesis
MRIAHVCPFYTPAIGGVKQVVEELAERQVRAGHEVHVFTSDWDKDKRVLEKEEMIRGVRVHRVYHWFKIANFASFWPGVFRKILKGNFDVVHTHVFGHPHFVLGAFAAKLSGAKHFHTTHCPWSDAHRSLVGRVGVILSYNILSRMALGFTDKVIAITPWEYSFIRRFGGKQEKIVNLPNGMAAEFFERAEGNDFKEKFGIDEKKLVLFFGRLNVVKAPDFFVDIAKRILEKRDDVRFVIRGPDEGLREIVRQKIGDEKRIILLEETRDRKEIIKMYQAADVFVLPSYREGLPLTLFEAMASGLPVVASPVNGVPYEIKEPDNGFLVKHGDVDGFARRVIEFLDDEGLRGRVSKNNLKRSESYSWEGISEKTLELYSV